MNLCDFCSSPAPAWIYPAESFSDMLGSRSIGEWLACECCHALIEAGDHDGLVEHAVASLTDVKVRKVSLLFCDDLFAKFREHRTGPCERIESSTYETPNDRPV